MQGISFFAPQESDQLTNNQLREYKMILSNGVKTILLERAVWDVRNQAFFLLIILLHTKLRVYLKLNSFTERSVRISK